ncbi:MAG: dipeptide ABC transporter ATP-binding protein [Rhodobacteraceae bacterium]|nr:dipeptide ABC transporter ATP-binding protein [Paracoccaceae bacterium]
MPEAPSQQPVVLAVRGLSVVYRTADGFVRPIKDLSLTIHEREVVGLVGDAASGKSTAALALMGIVRPPGRIETGEVVFAGQDLLSMDEDALRAIRGKDIGIIVQNPRGALNPMLRVGAQIGNVYRAHNDVTRKASAHHAVDMLRKVGINDPERRVEAFAHELSGGMAQRALIAMSLSSSPRLLIADEPTSGLDVTIQAQFLDEMWATVQATGSAIVLVTQDLGVIANYCDRVVVLHDGAIVENKPVPEFFANPEHPYSQKVMSLQRAVVSDDALPDRNMKAVGTARQSANLLSVSALTKHFPIRGSKKVVQAVQAVDFDIHEGETLGLVGESGSGKTTVGRCLLRLEEPTAGAISYRGENISGISKRDLRSYRSRMQIVFQDPFDSLNPRWTVGRILRETLDLHTALDAKEKTARSRELLEMVGLSPDILDRRPKGMGAGAMQRLNIARALASGPEFIVLDEPTSVLSPSAISELITLLRRLQDELGLSYLFISHDLTTVKFLCHRVAVMYLGQVVEVGTVDQIFNYPRHPYARALLASHLFPDPGDRRVDRQELSALSGEIPSPVDLPKGCYLAGRCPHALDQCHAEPQKLVALDDGRMSRCWRVAAGDPEVAQ